MDITAFIDTDVIISSLISESGAANFLIHESSVVRLISNISEKEVLDVVKRLHLDKTKLNIQLNKNFSRIIFKKSISDIKRAYEKYVTDIEDAHIIAGADTGKAKFLITYNMKDYKRDKIKEDLGILVMRPAQFLQYLRSLE